MTITISNAAGAWYRWRQIPKEGDSLECSGGRRSPPPTPYHPWSKQGIRRILCTLEYMFAIHHNDLKESVPHAKMNMSTLLSLTRKGDLEPSGYYYQVMHDLKELPRLAEPASGTTYAVSFSYHVSKKLENPQAIRILIGLEGWDNEGRKTDDPFQGYAFEIFLPDYNIQEAKAKRESLPLCGIIVRQICNTLQKAIMMFVDALMIFEVVSFALEHGGWQFVLGV
ncbi:hypothetical protein Tco_0713382 [Tanacetum coccineum]